MLFLSPINYLIILYFIAALLPTFFLMKYIYKQDTIEKEPPGLLWSLALKGVLAALASIILEMLGKSVLNWLVDPDNPKYVVLLAFLVVAVVEEGTKFFFLYRQTWNEFNFNYLHIGLIYAIAN